MRCSGCATGVTAGPAPGPGAYEEGVYALRAPRGRALVRLLQRATVAQPARALRSAGLQPGGRVLDVGAGTGRLVEELRRRGYDAYGIEPSERSLAIAEAAGRPVIRGAIEEHEESGLNAAALWHVLEHLDEPLSALVRVRSWLRPGGFLLVGVPNLASAQARVAGDSWLHFDVPRHRVHFTPDGLVTLLGRAGLEPVRTDHYVWEHNPAAMWMALLSRAGMASGLPFHLIKGTVSASPRDLALLTAGVPLLPVALGLEAVAAALRRGGTMSVVARAPA